MYDTALILHSALRWVALLAVLYAFVRAASGYFGNRPRTTGDKASAMVALIVVDVQLLLGLLLYFVWSPQTMAAREDMKAAMKNPELRLWAVEHPTLMVLAVILVHVGKILASKSKTPRAAHGRSMLCFGLSLLLMVFGTAWPTSQVSRPWFRT